MNVLIAMPVNRDLHPALKRSSRAIADAIPAANPEHTFELAWLENGGGAHTGYDQERYATIADARNALLGRYLTDDHNYVLWIDADLVRLDLDFPSAAIAHNPDGVTGLVVYWDKQRPHFYDVGGYAQNGEWARTYPPYWRNLGFPITDLDSVGCCYMIPADVYRAGARYATTEGFTEHLVVCQHAASEGRRVGCLMTHSAAHAYLADYSIQAWPPVKPRYRLFGGAGVEGHAYLFPVSTRDPTVHSHWAGHSEPETLAWLEQHARADWHTVDCGANIGTYTCWLSDHCEHVTAIEPHKPVAQMLIDALRYNNLHARVIVKAISDTATTVDELCLAGDLASTHGTWQTITIDEICADMPRVDCIKIDVDGYDYKALVGGLNTILRHQPAIIIECHDKSLTRFGDTEQDVANLLEHLGYDWTIADGRNWIATC